MRDCRGVTLVELIIVVSIISILVVALGFQFTGWIKGYRIESEVKQIYSDLMNARLRAMRQNMNQLVRFTANDYQAFDDKNGNCQYDSGADTPWDTFKTGARKLTDPLTALWTGTVCVDTKGLVLLQFANQPITIQVNSGTAAPDYDCIILTQTRVAIGKWNGTCVEN